jgi:hypothetical protein
LSGLRKGELSSLILSHLQLDGPAPAIDLRAADEKNGEGARLPVRADLAAELRDWVAEKLELARTRARESGAAAPSRLPPDTPLFDVPAQLSKIMNRDLKTAGIPKRDERDRTLDVHALRTTFGTWMSQAGVAPRVAQAAMRHSKLDLTMNVYTDPKMLDVARAVDALPALPPVEKAGERIAPEIAPSRCNPGHVEGNPGNGLASGRMMVAGDLVVGSALPVNEKGPVTTPVTGPSQVGATGFEPVTPSVSC